MILKATKENWADIKKIYAEGIATENATFETIENIKPKDEWFAGKVKDSVFVFIENQKVYGWAALSSVSDRCVYAGVAEVSVYVSSKMQGKGIGYSLLKKLIHFSEENSIWTLQAGIFSENEASIKLHKKIGFREIGIREKLGQLKGKWRDVVLMERRSKLI